MIPSCSAPKCWRSWLLTLLFLSWWWKLFVAGKFPVGAEQCWLEGWDDAGAMKLSVQLFLLFLCSYSQAFLFHYFPKLGLQSLPRAIFVHDSYVIDLCHNTDAGISLQSIRSTILIFLFTITQIIAFSLFCVHPFHKYSRRVHTRQYYGYWNYIYEKVIKLIFL